MDIQFTHLLIPVGIMIALFVAVEAGYRTGKRRMRAFAAEHKIETGAIQGAMLGLLGLMLGFGFAGAASRSIERQDLITREANPIGPAYRRADLLDKPHSDELKAALLVYLDHRVEISRTLKSAI